MAPDKWKYHTSPSPLSSSQEVIFVFCSKADGMVNPTLV